MAQRALAPIWVVLLFIFSGCAGKDAGPAKAGSVGASVAPESLVGEDTGGLYGWVVDVEQAPVPGAAVFVLPGDILVTTDAGGSYAFSELPPASYTIQVTSLQYVAASQTLRVEAGRASVANFTLEKLPTLYAGRYEAVGPFQGYLQCHMSMSVYPLQGTNGPCGTVPGAGATPVTGIWASDKIYFDFELTAPDWSEILLEARWASATAATKPNMVLYFSHADRSPNHWFARTVGGKPSPVQVLYDQQPDGNWTTNVPAGEPAVPAEDLTLRVWLTIPDASFFAPVDFAYEVRYEIWATIFYSSHADPAYSAFEG